MSLALKTIVGVFAVRGVAYTVLWFYAAFFLPHCMLSYAAQATSPTGKYFAFYQHSVCQDPDKSRSEVLIGNVEYRNASSRWRFGALPKWA